MADDAVGDGLRSDPGFIAAVYIVVLGVGALVGWWAGRMLHLLIHTYR